MKTLGILNINENIKKELLNYYECVELKNEFIDCDYYLIQYDIEKNLIILLNKIVKSKKKTILFDKNLLLNKKESKYLFDNNFLLFEPLLINRKYFRYLPIPIYITDDKIFFNNKKIETFYYNEEIDDKVCIFEKYYINLCRDYNYKVVLYNNNMPKKIEDYLSSNLSFNKINENYFKILINTDSKINRGYLPDLNFYFETGNIPLLPYEHKFYYAIFENLIIKDINDLNYITNNLSKIPYALLCGILDNIFTLFPEMKIHRFVSKIKILLEG